MGTKADSKLWISFSINRHIGPDQNPDLQKLNQLKKISSIFYMTCGWAGQPIRDLEHWLDYQQFRHNKSTVLSFLDGQIETARRDKYAAKEDFVPVL